MTEFEKLSLFYEKLAEQYLIEMFSLQTLEKRFTECATPFIPEKRPSGHLRFLYLQNKAHIERLDYNEIKILNNIYEDKLNAKEIERFLNETFPKVLAGDLRKDADYEFFPDLYGRGMLQGNAIVFCFKDQTAFHNDGRFDQETEKKKERIFNNVKRQFEDMTQKKSGIMIKLVRI